MNRTITPQEHSYRIANNILNKSLRKTYGKDYTVRINAIKFIENRTNHQYKTPNLIIDEIYFKSNKRVSLSFIKLINDFLFHKLNIILRMIELDDYKKVSSICLIFN
jgi:hypothetical protein